MNEKEELLTQARETAADAHETLKKHIKFVTIRPYQLLIRRLERLEGFLKTDTPSILIRNEIMLVEKAQDRLMCIQLSQKTGAEIKPVENDPNHISVNGELMGYEEFENWLKEHMPKEQERADA